jgi:hypothetical protein
MMRVTTPAWLRPLTFGHVRRLDRLTELLLARAWAAGAGATGQLVVRADSGFWSNKGHRRLYRP